MYAFVLNDVLSLLLYYIIVFYSLLFYYIRLFLYFINDSIQNTYARVFSNSRPELNEIDSLFPPSYQSPFISSGNNTTINITSSDNNNNNNSGSNNTNNSLFELSGSISSETPLSRSFLAQPFADPFFSMLTANALKIQETNNNNTDNNTDDNNTNNNNNNASVLSNTYYIPYTITRETANNKTFHHSREKISTFFRSFYPYGKVSLTETLSGILHTLSPSAFAGLRGTAALPQKTLTEKEKMQRKEHFLTQAAGNKTRTQRYYTDLYEKNKKPADVAQKKEGSETNHEDSASISEEKSTENPSEWITEADLKYNPFYSFYCTPSISFLQPIFASSFASVSSFSYSLTPQQFSLLSSTQSFAETQNSAFFTDLSLAGHESFAQYLKDHCVSDALSSSHTRNSSSVKTNNKSSSSSKNDSDDDSDDSDCSDETEFNARKIRLAFLNALVSLLKNYSSFITHPPPDTPRTHRQDLYMRITEFANAAKENSRFLRMFVETQMFQCFIEERAACNEFGADESFVSEDGSGKTDSEMKEKKEQKRMKISCVGDAPPLRPSHLIFDEAIDAKYNRKRLSFTKRSTPFLLDTRWNTREIFVTRPPACSLYSPSLTDNFIAAANKTFNSVLSSSYTADSLSEEGKFGERSKENDRFSVQIARISSSSALHTLRPILTPSLWQTNWLHLFARPIEKNKNEKKNFRRIEYESKIPTALARMPARNSANIAKSQLHVQIDASISIFSSNSMFSSAASTGMYVPYCAPYPDNDYERLRFHAVEQHTRDIIRPPPKQVLPLTPVVTPPSPSPPSLLIPSSLTSTSATTTTSEDTDNSAEETEKLLQLAEKQRMEAAVCIQSMWRMVRQQRQFEHTKTLVITTQANIRRFLCRTHYLRTRKNIITAQSCIRMHITYIHFRRLRSAAIHVQSTYRMKVARKKYLQFRTAVIHLQATFKMRQQRKKYLQMRRLIILTQAHFRGYAARKRYLHTRACIIRIQATFRMLHARMQYLSDYEHIIAAQSQVRRFIQQRRFARAVYSVLPSLLERLGNAWCVFRVSVLHRARVLAATVLNKNRLVQQPAAVLSIIRREIAFWENRYSAWNYEHQAEVFAHNTHLVRQLFKETNGEFSTSEFYKLYSPQELSVKMVKKGDFSIDSNHFSTSPYPFLLLQSQFSHSVIPHIWTKEEHTSSFSSQQEHSSVSSSSSNNTTISISTSSDPSSSSSSSTKPPKRRLYLLQKYPIQRLHSDSSPAQSHTQTSPKNRPTEPFLLLSLPSSQLFPSLLSPLPPPLSYLQTVAQSSRVFSRELSSVNAQRSREKVKLYNFLKFTLSEEERNNLYVQWEIDASGKLRKKTLSRKLFRTPGCPLNHFEFVANNLGVGFDDRVMQIT